MDIYCVNSFFEDLLFPLIKPLDNLYLFGGQVIEFVDELVYLLNGLNYFKYSDGVNIQKPQIKAPIVAPLEGAFTYGFAIRVYA